MSDMLEDIDPLFIQTVASVRGKNALEEAKLLYHLQDLQQKRQAVLKDLLRQIHTSRDRASSCINEVLRMRQQNRKLEEEKHQWGKLLSQRAYAPATAPAARNTANKIISAYYYNTGTLPSLPCLKL